MVTAITYEVAQLVAIKVKRTGVRRNSRCHRRLEQGSKKV